MIWELEYLPEALDDLASLDNSVRKPVIKGIQKVQKNPVSKEKGGYGTPLGNKGTNLTGLFKIKFLKYGIRIAFLNGSLPYEMNIIPKFYLQILFDNFYKDFSKSSVIFSFSSSSNQ